MHNRSLAAIYRASSNSASTTSSGVLLFSCGCSLYSCSAILWLASIITVVLLVMFSALSPLTAKQVLPHENSNGARVAEEPLIVVVWFDLPNITG